ncbi:MAG: substrate-binding domain-containing protein [Gammaproteobacteria bacterium]
MKIELGLRWWVGEKPAEELSPDLVRLLDGIARGGNLRFAAQDARLSYRHAWGLVKHWEARFGTKLVSLEQGRGSELTRAGELLRESWHRTRERTEVALAEAAVQASRAFEGLSAVAQGEKLVLAASHGFGVSALVTQLRDTQTEPDVHYVGSEEALKRYAAGECQVAGFHLPLGKHGRSLWLRFQRYLDPRRDVVLLVETRELGFMARPGTPRVDVRALAERKLRFQNRQTGSGSRLVFDLLLAETDLRPEAIVGYHNEEYTHVAVAAMIASGGADVGFGARAAAEKFQLEFWPEVTEKYFVVMPREELKRKPCALVPRLLAGKAYKHLLNETPGSDSRGSGKQLDLRHVATLIRGPRRVRRT